MTKHSTAQCPWNFSRQEYWSRIEPSSLVSPALAGRFLTTVPPGKTMYKIISTCCIVQRTQMHCGDPNRKEVRKEGDICICMTDSFCYTTETNATL